MKKFLRAISQIVSLNFWFCNQTQNKTRYFYQRRVCKYKIICIKIYRTEPYKVNLFNVISVFIMKQSDRFFFILPRRSINQIDANCTCQFLEFYLLLFLAPQFYFRNSFQDALQYVKITEVSMIISIILNYFRYIIHIIKICHIIKI